MAQMQQGLAAWHATGAAVFRPYGLALLAEAYAQVGRCEEGLTLLAEALALTNDREERRWEAELYRLKGELPAGALCGASRRGRNLLSSSPRRGPSPAASQTWSCGPL